MLMVMMMMTLMLMMMIMLMLMLMLMLMMMMLMMGDLVVDGSLGPSAGSSSFCRWWSTAEHDY